MLRRHIIIPSTPIRIGALKPSIHFIEVGPRDGLQNESKVLTIQQKQTFISKLANTGISHIEAGSFVNYKKVPTMKDSREVLQGLHHLDTKLSVLIPHVKELNDLPQNVSEIVLFVSTSNTFNQKNIGTTKEGAFERFQLMKQFLSLNNKNVQIRGSISCCWGCPYEGQTDSNVIMQIIDNYISLGATTIDLCDTIGVATPQSVKELLSVVLQKYPARYFSVHLHDTNGLAIDCSLTALEHGIVTLQGSIAGIGGCPFSSKRVGNVDSLSLLHKVKESGYGVDIDLDALQEVKSWILHTLK